MSDTSSSWQGASSEAHLLRLKTFAESAHQKGEFSKAESYWLAIQEEAEDFGPHDRRLTYVLERLAEAYWHQKKYAEAAPVCRRILKTYKVMLGRNHTDVGIVAKNLAILYHLWQKPIDAEMFYREALTIHKKTLGMQHPEVTSLIGTFRTFLTEIGKHQEAARLGSDQQDITITWTLSGIYKAMPQKAGKLTKGSE